MARLASEASKERHMTPPPATQSTQSDSGYARRRTDAWSQQTLGAAADRFAPPAVVPWWCVGGAREEKNETRCSVERNEGGNLDRGRGIRSIVQIRTRTCVYVYSSQSKQHNKTEVQLKTKNEGKTEPILRPHVTKLTPEAGKQGHKTPPPATENTKSASGHARSLTNCLPTWGTAADRCAPPTFETWRLWSEQEKKQTKPEVQSSQ